MKPVEVHLGSPSRGNAGRFSGVSHAFNEATKAALQKYALFDNADNAAELLAKLFRASNFGYESKGPRVKGRQSSLQDYTWGRETGFFAGGGASFNRAGV